MELHEIEPFVRIALTGYIDRTVRDDAFHTLTTPDCRLFYILRGKGEFILNGKKAAVEKNDCILFQSGTHYVWCPDAETGLGYFALNFDYTRHFAHLKSSFHPKHYPAPASYEPFETVEFSDAVCLNAPIVLKNAVSLQNRLQLAVTEFYMESDFREEFLSATLKSVLISIVRLYGEQSQASDGAKPFEIRALIAYIQQHYAEELSNGRLAAEFNFNPSYLSRKFKRSVGMPLHTFVTQYRIRMAMELLKTKQPQISELAQAVGFRDVYRFSKAFKAHIGVSPSEYRERGRPGEKF